MVNFSHYFSFCNTIQALLFLSKAQVSCLCSCDPPFIHSYCLVHLNLLLLSDGENNRNGHKKFSFVRPNCKTHVFKE